MKTPNYFLVFLLFFTSLSCKEGKSVIDDVSLSEKVESTVEPEFVEPETVTFEVERPSVKNLTDHGNQVEEKEVQQKEVKNVVPERKKDLKGSPKSQENSKAKIKTLAKKPKKAQNLEKGVMVFDTEVHDFGFIEMGEKVDFEFKFTNKGNAPINIQTADATCGCTTPTYTFLPIEPGKRGIISVHFESEGRLGSQNAVITVSSDAREPISKLELKGVVRAEVAKSTESKIKSDSL